ncbi:MAG: hypothetical protein QF464_09595 [Myxococcota bacterium]|jgi:hypothetical protein|nr:hypothetical protein [Myxococcota bacterium]
MTPTRAIVMAVAMSLWCTNAQATEPSAEARRWYTLAVQAAQEGRWVDAGEAFERADSLAPSPTLRFNAAQALARGGEVSRARALYEALLIATETPKAIRVRVTAALVDLADAPPPAPEAPPPGSVPMRFRTALQQGYRVQVTDTAGRNQACHELVGPKDPCVLHVQPGDVRVLVEGGVSINEIEQVPEVGLTVNLHTQGSGLLAGSVLAWSGAALSIGLIAAGAELESTDDMLLFSLGIFCAATAIPMALGFTVAYADHKKLTRTLGAADYDAAAAPGGQWSGVAIAPAKGGAMLVTGATF